MWLFTDSIHLQFQSKIFLGEDEFWNVTLAIFNKQSNSREHKKFNLQKIPVLYLFIKLYNIFW